MAMVQQNLTATATQETLQEMGAEFLSKFFTINLAAGLTEALREAESYFKSFILDVFRFRLEQLDDLIFETPGARPGFNVCHKGVPRTLLTSFGPLLFARRYYKSKDQGTYAYLVDDVVGIDAHDRVEKGLSVELCAAASDMSYAKSSAVCCQGLVSRQTVKNKLAAVVIEDVHPVSPRTHVKQVHLQCDEDHVSLQKKPSTTAKLCVMHEQTAFKGKRAYLPERYAVPARQGESNMQYWERIHEILIARYGTRDDLRVYIHGDGASWIKTGQHVIPRSKMVLDRFHLVKRVNRIAGVEKAHRQMVWDQLNAVKLGVLDEVILAFIDSGICTVEDGYDFLTYCQNNYQGIRAHQLLPDLAARSSAEGQVSHLLSARLSSRPLSWGTTNLSVISQLRGFHYNKGTLTPEHVKPRKQPSVSLYEPPKRVKKIIDEKMSDFLPMPTGVFKTEKRGTALYRLFERIKSTGLMVC